MEGFAQRDADREQLTRAGTVGIHTVIGLHCNHLTTVKLRDSPVRQIYRAPNNNVRTMLALTTPRIHECHLVACIDGNFIRGDVMSARPG